MVPVSDYLQRLEREVQLDENFKRDYEQWLEQNVWDYYD